MENTYLAIFRYARRILEVGEKIPEAMQIENCKQNSLKFQKLEGTEIAVEKVQENIAKDIYTVEAQGNIYVCVPAIKEHARILLNQSVSEKPEMGRSLNYAMLVDTEYFGLGPERVYGPYIRFEKNVGVRAAKLTQLSDRIYLLEDRFKETFVVID